MRLKTWHCLALLTFVVLLAYYPCLGAGYNSADDLKMLNSVAVSGSLNPLRFFVRSHSYYYRPLTILTYRLDLDLWGGIASFMHLENILLHLVCTVLVFFITRRILALQSVYSRWPALFAGLLFGLHPIVTESVSWISGRTDVLMTVFLLLCVSLTLAGLAYQRSKLFIGAGVALFLAPLAKEVAVFILPALLWLIAIYPGEAPWRKRLRQRWWPMLTTSSAVAGYFVLRALAIGHDSGVSTALRGVAGGGSGLDLLGLLDKVRVAFKVYGFYFKKLFLPWPLNYAIVEVSDWYVLSGIVLLVLLLYLVWRADVPGAFGLMAFCLLSPALLVVYGQMAWTLLAERYLYASAAFSAPLLVWVAVRLRVDGGARAGLRRALIPSMLLLMLFFGTTLHRAWIWQDNVRLYRDTVSKSLNFPPAKVDLASALLRSGKEAEAREILAGLKASGVAPDYINGDLNLAATYLNGGEPEKARDLLLPLLDKNPKKRFKVLQALIRTNDQLLLRVTDPQKKMTIQRQNLDWLLEEQRIRPRAFTQYRIGKRYLALGQKDRALEYFKNACARAPDDAHYREAAATFIRRLEGS